MVSLTENIREASGYCRFREKTIALISKYLSVAAGTNMEASDLFEIAQETEGGDCIEQIINASDGNTCRLTQILDMSMTVAYAQNEGKGRVTLTM